VVLVSVVVVPVELPVEILVSDRLVTVMLVPETVVAVILVADIVVAVSLVNVIVESVVVCGVVVLVSTQTGRLGNMKPASASSVAGHRSTAVALRACWPAGRSLSQAGSLWPGAAAAPAGAPERAAQKMITGHTAEVRLWDDGTERVECAMRHPGDERSNEYRKTRTDRLRRKSSLLPKLSWVYPQRDTAWPKGPN
jgi:hypothetical protein